MYLTRIVSDIETGIILDWDELDYSGPVLECKQTDAQKAADKTNVAKGQAGLAAGTQLGSQAQGIQGTLLPAYQSILSNPGYSSADKSAMTLNTLGGLGASFGDAADSATNRTARTRNSAGYGETLDELSRERGRQTSTAEAGLQSKFADTALSERDKALSGMSNLYGVDTDTMAKLLSPGAIQQNKGGLSVSGGIPGVAQVGFST